MKKILLYTALLCALIGINSCSLSMDEYIEEPEDEGYGELATLESEFGKISYQFKESTRSLTPSIQEFIADVEADTILYFLDNIPSAWMPKVGGCVVANCGERFPMGLIARVQSITHQNGMYRVVTTLGSIDDAYEEFDAVYDFDYNPALILPDTDSAEVVTVTDWSIFDADSVNRNNEASIRRRAKLQTRAEADEPDEKETDEKKLDRTEIVTFDAGKYSYYFPDWAKKYGLTTLQFKAEYETNKHIYKHIIKSKDYERTEITSTDALVLTIGAHKSSKNNKEAKKGITDEEFKKLYDEVKNEVAKNPKKKTPFTKEGWMVNLPIPGPIPFVMQITPAFDFDLNVYGSAEFKVYTGKTYSVTEYDNGEKKLDYTEEKENPSNTISSATIGGNMTVSGGLEVVLAVGRAAGGFGAGVGIYAKPNLEGNLEVNHTFGSDGEYVSSRNGLTIRGLLDIGPKAFVKTPGGKEWGFDFAAHTFILWDGVNYPWWPSVKKISSVNHGLSVEGNVSVSKVTASYQCTSMGLLKGAFELYPIKPMLRMYLSYDGSNYKDYVDLYADKGGDKLKAGATYNFTLHDTQGYRYYKAVPLLVDVTDPTIKKELSDFAFEVESSAEEPRIDLFPASYTRSSEYAVAYQTGFSDKPDLTKWPGADPSEQWYEYEFCFPFQLKNGSYIDLWWESITFEGTLEYSAFNNVKKKIPFSRVLPSNMKTGLYVIRVKFLSNVHENNYFAWSVRPKLVVKKKDGKEVVYPGKWANDPWPDTKYSSLVILWDDYMSIAENKEYKATKTGWYKKAKPINYKLQ